MWRPDDVSPASSPWREGKKGYRNADGEIEEVDWRSSTRKMEEIWTFAVVVMVVLKVKRCKLKKIIVSGEQ